MSKRTFYGALGALLASGVPAGLLGLRLGGRRAPLNAANVRDELRSDPAGYAYVTVATSIALSAFGFMLGRQADHLEALSFEDSLTGLHNQRGLGRRLDEELSHAKRYREPLALLFIDVDGLKGLNDRFGHRAGDRALREVADCIRAEIRSADVGSRWGGDEFAVLAANTGGTAALVMAERIRARVAETRRRDRVTVSIGVAVFAPDPAGDGVDGPALVEAADAALYAAKRWGRNRVGPLLTCPV